MGVWGLPKTAHLLLQCFQSSHAESLMMCFVCSALAARHPGPGARPCSGHCSASGRACTVRPAQMLLDVAPAWHAAVRLQSLSVGCTCQCLTYDTGRSCKWCLRADCCLMSRAAQRQTAWSAFDKQVRSTPVYTPCAWMLSKLTRRRLTNARLQALKGPRASDDQVML